jgi:branched-chain amino acid transport system substrate-binding protein
MQMPSQTAVYAPGEPILIGFSGLLTSTTEPQTDADIVKALTIALAETPTVTVGGVEFTLELLPQEDHCTDVGGRESAAAFIRNLDVIGVIGATCSSACRTMSIVFDQANYTSISPSCTASTLAAEFNSFHRVIANDDAQGVEGAIFVLDYLGYIEIAVISDGTEYGIALADIFGASIQELGADLVYQGTIERFQTDFDETVQELEAAQPELIFYAGLAGEAANLLKAVRAAGLTEVEFMITDGSVGREFIALAGADAEGVYASQPTAPDTDALDLFNAKYVRRYGRPPTTIYHPYAVDALSIFRAAIEAVGKLDADGNLVIDRIALRNYVSTYGQGKPIEGLSGDLLCNGDGECALQGVSFYQVVNDKFTLLDSSLTIDLDF